MDAGFVPFRRPMGYATLSGGIPADACAPARVVAHDSGGCKPVSYGAAEILLTAR